MARTVDATYAPPRRQAIAVADVMSLDPGAKGGLLRVASALNTLYEQHRGSLIMDTSRAMIVDSGGRTDAYYRIRPMGKGGLADELLEVYFDLETTGAAQVDWSAGGAASWSGTTARALVQTSTDPALTDSGEYVDATVAVNSGTVSVYGISVGYQRAKAALTAVGAGSAGYSNGIVPIDLLNVTDEAPLSVARLLDLHAIAAHLRDERPGQIVASAYETARATTIWCAATTPIRRSKSATARFYVRTDGAGTETITISGSGDSDSVTASAGEDWVGPLDVEVVCPDSVIEWPRWEVFEVDVDGCDVYGISGWWRDE